MAVIHLEMSPGNTVDLWAECGCWIRPYEQIDRMSWCGGVGGPRGVRDTHYRMGWRDYGWGKGMRLACMKHRERR